MTLRGGFLKGTTHLACVSMVEKRKGVEAGFPVGTNMGEETQDLVSVSALMLVP